MDWRIRSGSYGNWCFNKKGTATAKLYQSEAREERLKPSVKTTLKKPLKFT